MLDVYNHIPKEKWSGIIEDAKFSVGFYGDDNAYVTRRMMGKVAFDPTLQYPYSWITVVEVPCDFHVVSGKYPAGGREGTRRNGVFPGKKILGRHICFFY